MRLKNHAIYAPLSEMQKMQLQAINSMSVPTMLLLTDGTPQFKIFKDDMNIQTDELEFVLDFLAFFNNKRDLSRGIYYIKVSDGYIVSLKPKWQAKFLLNLHDNIQLFNSAEQKEFMSAILNAKSNTSIFDSKDGIIAKAFELRQSFPAIRSNQDGYYERCTIESMNATPETQGKSNIHTIPSKEAIRNEYVSHYNTHPSDYDNKETLEDNIYTKLKPLYPKLSLTLIKSIGKDVREERGMSRKGRPQGRGNVIKKR